MTTGVTRVEIATALDGAFGAEPCSRLELADAAAAAGARTQVLVVPAGLPEQEYRSLRDLWVHLGQVPVGL